MGNILFLIQYNKKMNEANKHIKKFNSLSYNDQCKHVKTKYDIHYFLRGYIYY